MADSPVYTAFDEFIEENVDSCPWVQDDAAVHHVYSAICSDEEWSTDGEDCISLNDYVYPASRCHTFPLAKGGKYLPVPVCQSGSLCKPHRAIRCY